MTTSPVRDIPGALYGSRLITLPHVAAEVAAVRAFVAGPAPVLAEVGFDHGRRLSSTATHNSHWRILGLETRKRRVEEANARAHRDGLTNLLAWRMDARTVFAGVLDDACVDIVEILFPTPWWSAARRRKRLLIDDRFVADLARTVAPGGWVHLATDVPRYAAHIADCFGRSPRFDPALDPAAYAAARPSCEQRSRRQWKCEREGIPVSALSYRRLRRSGSAEAPRGRLEDPGQPGGPSSGSA